MLLAIVVAVVFFLLWVVCHVVFSEDAARNRQYRASAQDYVQKRIDAGLPVDTDPFSWGRVEDEVAARDRARGTSSSQGAKPSCTACGVPLNDATDGCPNRYCSKHVPVDK